MPMRWDAQADQKLLVKLLEAHPDFPINVAKMSELWPESENEVGPTSRAVKDRLKLVRKGAGITTPMRTTGTAGPAIKKSTQATYINAKPQDSGIPATATPLSKLNFIHSSFPNPFRTAEKGTRHTSGNKRKRKQADESSEDETVATSESEDESAAAAEELTPPSSKVRSSTRVRRTKANYNLKDLQSSGEENNQEDSDDSDAVYDPNEEKAKQEKFKRGRLRRAGELIDVDEA